MFLFLKLPMVTNTRDRGYIFFPEIGGSGNEERSYLLGYSDSMEGGGGGGDSPNELGSSFHIT